MNRLYKQFIKCNSTLYCDISKCLNEGNIKQAHRLAHNLKAHAGMIKQQGLYDIAYKIESSLANNTNRATKKDMETLRMVLKSTIDDLSAILKNEESPEETIIEHDSATVIRWMNELKPLLESGNLEYLDYADRLRAVPGADNLVDHLETFDESGALTILEELQKQSWGA